MDSEKTKRIVIAACLVGGVLLFGSWILKGGFGRIQGVESVPEGKTIWVKCVNRACGVSYEMNLKEYYRQVDQRISATGVPPLDCEKCGKPSLYRATKCPNCGEVYVDSRDKCPKCGSSDRD